jgi:hypothetical protein
LVFPTDAPVLDLAEMDFEKLIERGKDWDPGLATMHIFVKETIAACWSIQAALSRYHGPLTIHIGIDNSAALASIKHLYSSNRTVVPFLLKIHELLKNRRSVVLPYGLRSEDNAADEPSRDKKVSKSKFDWCLQVLYCAIAGHRITNTPDRSPDFEGKIRHTSCKLDDSEITDGVIEQHLMAYVEDPVD